MRRLHDRAPYGLIPVFLLWTAVYYAGAWPDMTTPEPTWDSGLVFVSAVAMVIFGVWEFTRGGVQVGVAALRYLGVALAARKEGIVPGVGEGLVSYLRHLAPGGLIMAKAWLFLGMGSLLMNAHKLG